MLILTSKTFKDNIAISCCILKFIILNTHKPTDKKIHKMYNRTLIAFQNIKMLFNQNFLEMRNNQSSLTFNKKQKTRIDAKYYL